VTRQKAEWSSWIVVAGVACGAIGCGQSGPATSAVSGKVVLSGKPVEGATVTFVPEKGAPAMATTDASGEFRIDRAVRGTSRVTITKVSGGGPAGMPASPTPADMARMAAAQGGKKQEQPKSAIPEKYGRVQSSGLTADVGADTKSNVYSFNLAE
jgi:hypothetical protein